MNFGEGGPDDLLRHERKSDFQMKGLFKTAPGPGNMEIRETTPPEAGSGQVVIEVMAAGLCASDLHIMNWDINFSMRPPMIIGHEFCGVIVSVGNEVADWQVGERVTCEPTFSTCGSCRHCRNGDLNLCLQRKVIGYWHDGCFARFIVVPARRLHRLPENVDFHEGALSEPLACCIHGVLERTSVRANETVGIGGPGTIGLLSLQLAKAEGARTIAFGTSHDRQRLQLATNLGADVVVNVEDHHLMEAVSDFTGGHGLDVFLECSGSGAAADLGLEVLRKRGRYCQLGLFGSPIRIDFEKLAYKEIAATGAISQRWSSWTTGLDLVARKDIQLKPLITDVMPLSKWPEAFEKLQKKECLKVLLLPD